jgi:hypothetical protein
MRIWVSERVAFWLVTLATGVLACLIRQAAPSDEWRRQNGVVR